jgi:hypothetical protein
VAKLDKKTARTVIVVFLLVIVAYSMRFIANRRDELDMAWLSSSLLRSGIYIGLFIAWGVSVRRRIIQVRTKQYLSAISALIVLWMAVRTLKFMIFDNQHFCRYLWYLYYVSQIMIPLMLILVACSLGKPENYRLPKWTNLLYVPAAALLLLILSNDLHQLAFGFPKGLTYIANGEYTHEIVYFLAIGWIALTGITALFILVIKCRVPGKKKMIWMPCIPILVLVAYGVLSMLAHTAIRRFAGDMTVISCLLCIAMLESFIRCRLIPSNTNYDELFRISAVNGHITDEKYNVLISTNNAPPLNAETMRLAEAAPVMLDGGIRLSSAPLKCGHALWTDDVSELTKLIAELEDTHEHLQGKNTALSEEYKTQRRLTSLSEKNRLYNKMQMQTEEKVNLLSDLVERFAQADNEQAEKELLARIAVLGAYIKRRNNLIFLAEDQNKLPAAELRHCIKESLQNLTLFGISADMLFTQESSLPFHQVTQFYDMFEYILEYAFDTLVELFVSVTPEGSAAKMAVRLCCKEDMSAISVDGLTVSNEDTDEWLLSFRIPEGGAAE